MEQYRERFESMCKPDGECIIFKARRKKGSGKSGRRFYLTRSRSIPARRMGWILSGGLVCDKHIEMTCGRRDCVNPEHMRLKRRPAYEGKPHRCSGSIDDGFRLMTEAYEGGFDPVTARVVS